MTTGIANVRVQHEAFDIQSEINEAVSGDNNIGAMVNFVGYCRGEDETLAGLELEHYPGMAEAQLMKLANHALAQWPLMGAHIVHRYGYIEAGAPIVLVITTSRHRSAAFESANFLMDYLKTQAPFWKRPKMANGEFGEWVAANPADDDLQARWQTDGFAQAATDPR